MTTEATLDSFFVFRSAKLLKRDPRMVERKKTGRAKARKAVCSLVCPRWRHTDQYTLSVHLGQAVIPESARTP